VLGISRRSCPYSWTQGKKDTGPSDRLSSFISDARHEWTGDYRRLRDTLIDHSRFHHSIVLYAGAGEGESVNEGVFAGHRLIVCDGHVLAEGQPFTTGLTTAVIPEKVLSELAPKAESPR